MRTTIFSDVHGNLPALEAFIAKTWRTTDVYYCLGDTLGYGPWPMECLKRVFDICGDRVLLGKHDIVGLLGTTSGLTPMQELMWKPHRELIDTGSPTMKRLRKMTYGLRYGKDAQMLRRLGTRPPASGLVFVPQLEESHQQGSRDFLGLLGGKRARAYACGSVGMDHYTINRIGWCEYDTTSTEVCLQTATYDPTPYETAVKAMGMHPAAEDLVLLRGKDRAMIRNIRRRIDLAALDPEALLPIPNPGPAVRAL